ncbi:O-antigen ligase [Sporosarcina sp. BI001-red]|uniref:O-antigen ligase family protein n=1 Tax=Sporosarcina sp. BI001-red TaxID=2282866 RepID=UPI0011C063ED|nr:O-antigen ligase family protein [Sporosarcina sp. BI001-red]
MTNINSLNVKENMRLYHLSALVIFISVFFQSFYIDLQFAVKPFMIASALIAVLISKYYVIPRFLKFELLLFTFFIYYCLTGLFSTYKYYSLRLIVLIVIVLFFYSLVRFLFYRLSIASMEKIIMQVGLIFNISSLLFFFNGVFQVNFDFAGNNITSMGLLIDRGMPRLIGTSIDPNIFVLFNSLFLFYFIERKHKLGTILSITTIILTFSRGGYIAVGLPLILGLIVFKNKGRAKSIFGILLTSMTVPFILNFLFDINIWKIINGRFMSIGDDRGSGRYEIWGNALQLFWEHPFFGIGIYNFQQYNLHYFNDFHYPHNTYLEILVESGIVGFTLFLLVLVTFAFKLYELQKARTETRFLLLTLLSMMISMFTLSTAVSEFLFLFFALSFRYVIENEKRWEYSV